MLIEINQMNNMEAFKLNNGLSLITPVSIQYLKWHNIILLDPSTLIVMSLIT